jgi:two-component system nitrogen regulation response regulator NtrX
MPETILIVDDERGIRESLRGVLEDEGFKVEKAESGEAGLRILETRSVQCVLLDVWLPGMDGIATLERIRAIRPDLPIVMISGHGTIETAVRAIRLGAVDFIEKPLHIEKTLSVVRKALEFRAPDESEDAEASAVESQIIGDSVPMRALRQQISFAAPTDGRVLIYGESGTGKELAAQALHAGSLRAADSFVALNCAAVPEELIESELFGHVKGAFTGATTGRRGKFEQASGGTLFLDEVGDMSLRMQAKLLRVLEERCIEPVGGSAPVAIDVRVIAATNKRLDEEIERGAFRADLFYRLNVIPFQIPPLREHLEDLPALTEHFARMYQEKYNRRDMRFSDDAMEKMHRYEWPGNVRELRNIVERMIIMVQRAVIEPDDLPFASGDAPLASSFRFDTLREANEAYEREFIQRKLAECNGNVAQAAEAMSVDRSHLYRRIKALGISIRG